MRLTTLPRTTLTTSLALARLPIDRALRIVGADDRNSAFAVAIDRLDLAIRNTAAVILRDPVLEEDVRRRSDVLTERRRALALRDEAERVQDRAEQRLDQRHDQAQRRRRSAESDAERRRQRAERIRGQRQAAAARDERQELAAAERRAERRGDEIEADAREARHEELESTAEALEQREEALAKEQEAARIAEVAARVKEQRKASTES